MTFKATRRLGFTALTAMAAGTACAGGDSETPQDSAPVFEEELQPGHEVTAAYAPELGIDLTIMTRLPSGVYVRDLELGAGDSATAGDRVSIDYTGWLANGARFDTSEGDPIMFTLGVGEVIDGWDEGIAGMVQGARRVLVIPPALAYGDMGRAGVIPPNATLVFDVRLVDLIHDSTAVPIDTLATRP
jgi:FKBP-type peptidyl-prolyl cis-trans isomerase FkpA